jgi:hypothetical protein
MLFLLIVGGYPLNFFTGPECEKISEFLYGIPNPLWLKGFGVQKSFLKTERILYRSPPAPLFSFSAEGGAKATNKKRALQMEHPCLSD